MNSKQIKFSLYYFFSISVYAFILAFFPIHCKVIGLSALEIGIVTAFGTLATVLGPPVAIHFAHHFLSPRKIIVYSSMATVAAFLPLLYTTSLYPLAIAWLCVNTFKRAGDSLVDTKALSFEDGFSFERVRMWGSIGFMLMIGILGPLVDHYGDNVILPFGLMLSVAVLFSSLYIRTEIDSNRGRDRLVSTDLKFINAMPRDLMIFCVILVLAFGLITASHSAAYIYLSIYLRALKWSASEISWAWNIGVFAEVLMFAFFSKFEKRFGLLGSLFLSSVFAAIRWYILATYDQKIVILLSQLLHSFSFAACYTASVKLVAKVLPPVWRDRGQGVILSVGFGVGSVLGRFVIGFFAQDLDSDKELRVLFLISAYFAISAILLLSLLFTRKSILEKKFA